MSKYTELKERIEGLDDGWNKEADDVLNEIIDGRPNNKISWYIAICSDSNISILDHTKKTLKSFGYMGQCSKMTAFKEALMWLLDHSDIAKEDKARAGKRDKLQKQLDKIQVELDELN